MSTYKELHGRSIVPASSNPAASGDAGKIFYNSTDNVFRSIVSGEAFSSSAPLATARYSAAFAGPQTANFVAAGAPGNIAATEEYNGTGFSAGGDVNQGRDGMIGAGTLTAGLGMGGIYPGTTYVGLVEEYDGSSWSEVTNLSQARGYANGAGIQTAAWLSGGRQGPPYSNPSQTEHYDGTNWTSGGALATNTRTGCFSGPQTAAWIVGGTQPNETDFNSIYQEYDGSTWTNGPSNPTAITNGGGSGTQTLAVAFGVQTAPAPNGVTTVFKYDGTTWATSPATLATARRSVQKGMGPSGTAAICAGGRNPSAVALTEEYNVTSDTITAAAWASGTALPSARFNGASAGTATAGIIAGGELAPGTRTGETVYFDGSSWTAQPATLSPAPNADGVKMAGTQTAAILNSFRGGGSPGPAYTDARSWNGSAWSTIPSTSSNHSFSNLFRNGTPSAATTIGGDNETTGIQTAVEEYNGSSWGSETALPAGRGNMAAFGTPTAGVIAGGNLGPGTPNRTATALEYDGSSWTTTGSITAAATTVGGGGTQTTGIIFGGYNPSPAATGNTNTYDGTAFSTAPTMATARGGLYSIGDSSGAYAAGGNPPVSTTVEEFTPETTAVNVKTITTS